jgi:hypothetical protein
MLQHSAEREERDPSAQTFLVEPLLACDAGKGLLQTGRQTQLSRSPRKLSHPVARPAICEAPIFDLPFGYLRLEDL